MILNIAVKDFYNNLVSSRFAIGLVLSLLLIPFAMIVSITDYGNKLERYEIDRGNADKKFEVRVWSELRPDVIREPEPLSVFCRGIDNNVGTIVQIRFSEKPLFAAGNAVERDNPFLNSFFSLDFMSIVTMLMSLLALMFSCDACSGETESGTFRLVFSNPVSRAGVLAGKILGIILSLVSVIVFCFLLSAIIVMLHPSVSLDTGDWVRVGLFFALCVLYLLFFVGLGVLVSSLNRTSETSAVVCLFLWVATVFIVPNLASYAARSMITVDSQENLAYTLGDVQSGYWTEFRAKWGELFPMLEHGVQAHQHAWDDDGYRLMGGASKDVFEFFRHLNAYCEPLRLEYAEKKWVHQQAYLERLDKVRVTAEKIALLSPSEIMRLTAARLCRTDAGSYYRFLDSARRYRDELADYFLDNDLFSSYAYFTPHPPKLFKTADERIRIKTGGRFSTYDELASWRESHPNELSPQVVEIHEEDAYSYPLLDVSNVPRYRGEKTGLQECIGRIMGKLLYFILGSILLFFGSYISFIRYDVR